MDENFEFWDLSESNDFYCGYYKAKLDAIKAVLTSEEIRYTDCKLKVITAILEVKYQEDDS